MSLDTESRQFVGHCGAPRQQLFPARNICSASIFPGTGPFGGIQFSLAPLNATILKSGGRGASSSSSGVLQDGQGMPALPQSYARVPSQGRRICLSQSQPQSSQHAHFIANTVSFISQ